MDLLKNQIAITHFLDERLPDDITMMVLLDVLPTCFDFVVELVTADEDDLLLGLFSLLLLFSCSLAAAAAAVLSFPAEELVWSRSGH